MSHGHSPLCPHCGRTLTESELYCYSCELDVSDATQKGHGNPHSHAHDGHPRRESFLQKVASKLKMGQKK